MRTKLEDEVFNIRILVSIQHKAWRKRDREEVESLNVAIYVKLSNLQEMVKPEQIEVNES